MRIRVSPTVRVTFGLLMLTLSLVFVADWLGLIPRERALEIEQRKRFSEILAVQLTSLARAGGNEHIRATLTALVERDDAVESAALRIVGNDTLIEVGNHSELWTLSEADDGSTSSQIIVPVYRGDERWGSVQVRFREPVTIWYSIQSWNSFVTLILFLIVSGFVLYFLFLRRVLRELDPRQVIPERVISAFNALAEGVLILDSDLRVVLANTAFINSTSLEEPQLIGMPIDKLNWSAYKHEPVPKPGSFPWSKVVEGGGSLTGSRLTIHKGTKLERSYTVNCTPVTDADNVVRGAIVTFDDLTEIERNNQKLSETLVELKQTQADITLKNVELQHLATKDPLTNSLNRRAFTERYRVLFDNAVENRTELVCIMADIDHFKRINDNYGHGVGDKVIKFVADVLRRQLRKDDLLARYGGEEFCIILDGVTLEQAREVAERMRGDIISGDPTMFTAALRVTTSFGLASVHDEMGSSDELINKADKALYLSKEGGRNKVTLWDSDVAESDAKADAEVLPVASLVASEDDPSERIRKLEAIAEERAEQFDHFAAFDQATQLPVRGLFMDRVEQALMRAEREKQTLAVLSLGLSNLSRVNDTLSHDAAQEFVRKASERLKAALRDTDTVSLMSKSHGKATISKLNDGEFGVLLPSLTDPESITWIVKRIFDALQEPLYIEDHLLTIEGNAGIGIYPADGNDASTLLKHASISRYFAEQQSGRNNVEYFSEQINRVSRAQLRLEGELAFAIDRDQFRVVYQPKIDLSSGEITGFEALLRWDHPEKGLLTPNEFIDIAERTRLINLIGDWVLRQACIHINALSEECGRRLTLAVNFSPVQFSQEDLVDRILRIVEETETDAHRLELELTESCLVNNFEVTLAALSKLQMAGVNISMDDFGTGYSGLSALRNLPVNILKIDRSFIADVNTSDDDRTIVRAIIAMAKALGLSVVAEGIENPAQLKVLTSMGCDEAQGYLFSRPVSIEKARELLLNPESALDALR
ncbi:MAG: EAL domain-containing protein [Congregibacter sp.]